MRARARRYVLAASALAVVGSAGAASASTLPIVTVTHNDGGTQVGTGLPGQPLVGVSVDNGGVCVGFSYETGSCLPVQFG